MRVWFKDNTMHVELPCLVRRTGARTPGTPVLDAVASVTVSAMDGRQLQTAPMPLLEGSEGTYRAAVPVTAAIDAEPRVRVQVVAEQGGQRYRTGCVVPVEERVASER